MTDIDYMRHRFKYAPVERIASEMGLRVAVVDAALRRFKIRIPKPENELYCGIKEHIAAIRKDLEK